MGWPFRWRGTIAETLRQGQQGSLSQDGSEVRRGRKGGSMSRKKIKAGEKHPSILFLELVDGPNYKTKTWLSNWKAIFRAAKIVPEQELKIFKRIPKPANGTAFTLLQYDQPLKPGEKRVPLTYFAVKSTADLLARLQYAIEMKDGEFFRSLAQAIEEPDDPMQPIRAYLLARFFDWSDSSHPPKQTEMITAKELQKELFDRHGITADERNLRRQCASVGVKLLEAKQGRPEKKKLGQN
jgi:hypothetical protein